MTPYRDTSWSPLFASFPPDCVPPADSFTEPDAPLQRLLNVVLLDMTKRGFGIRWTPDAPDARFVVFRDGERLAEENPSPALAAAFFGRLRELSGLRQPPPEVGRITLLLGESRSAVFAVHARLAGERERVIVSPLRGVDAPRPLPNEANDVTRLLRALEEARVDDDDAKLERVLEGARRLKSRMGAQLAAEAALALGHLAFHEGSDARPRYEESLAHARQSDPWSVAAALECLAGVEAEGGRDPREAFATLFAHLDAAFGASDPVTLGWKSDVVARMVEVDPAIGTTEWRRLRPMFVAVFGEDDLTVTTLDAP
ncbi:MAG: hypothetical protein KC586_09870 [Myxococcales bacterium]|nr:hypothetical protein [Myxococcales bacterium]